MESYDPLTGEATITVQALDAGSSPRIHWAAGSIVSEASEELKDLRFKTRELRLAFLAIDPSKGSPTGDPTIWKNKISILFAKKPSVDGREISIVVAPGATSIRYTADATSPRAAGKEYNGPFTIPADQDVLIRVLAIDGEIEAEEQKSFDKELRSPSPGEPGPTDRVPTTREYVDERRPASLVSPALAWTATKDTYDALDALQAASASAVGKRMTIGEGDRAITIAMGSGNAVSGEHLKGLLSAARAALELDEASATMSLSSIRFPTGKDLLAFLEATRIDIGDPRESIRQGGLF